MLYVRAGSHIAALAQPVCLSSRACCGPGGLTGPHEFECAANNYDTIYIHTQRVLLEPCQ